MGYGDESVNGSEEPGGVLGGVLSFAEGVDFGPASGFTGGGPASDLTPFDLNQRMDKAAEVNSVIDSRDGSLTGQDREIPPASSANQQPAPPNQNAPPANSQGVSNLPPPPITPTNQTALDTDQNNMTDRVNEQDLPEDSAEKEAKEAIMSEEAGDASDQNQRLAIELGQGGLTDPPVREIENSDVPSQPG